VRETGIADTFILPVRREDHERCRSEAAPQVTHAADDDDGEDVVDSWIDLSRSLFYSEQSLQILEHQKQMIGITRAGFELP